MIRAVLSSVGAMACKLMETIQSSPSSDDDDDDCSRHSVEENLKLLMGSLHRIQSVICDAELRKKREDLINLWVKELNRVAYDAEDVLDEYQYELRPSEIKRMCRKRKREEQQQVSDLSSTPINSSIHQSFMGKIKHISERFDGVARIINSLHLKEKDGLLNWVDFADNPRPVSPVADVDSGVVGREKDKEKLIELLSSDVVCKFYVIPILGVGGLGKTTLATLVQKDPRVSKSFDYNVWVPVCDDFDVKRIARNIIKFITEETYDFEELYAIQTKLEEIVEEKTIFLVLDDIRYVHQNDWDSFKAIFADAIAVKIIVTTRNESVSSIMHTVPTYRLDYLPADQCWLLFCQHAFGGQDPERSPNLVKAGLQVVKRCGDLPLAVRILGALLANETDEDRWRNIIQSDLLDSASHINEVSPALLVGYHYMPAPMQACFLYASMFPKNYIFRKDQLVSMWLAQGYIQPRSGKRLEDIGLEYFDELHRRSFLQLTRTADGKENFMMGDMFRDLAHSVSTDDCFTVKFKNDEETCILSDQLRHLHVDLQKGVSLMSLPFSSPCGLRTLSVRHGNNIAYDCRLENFGCLRSLTIHCKEFPDSACNLKHLRYLDFRSSSTVRLPESICQLYNLQTLNLKYCQNGLLFPRSFENLINLRHLYLPMKFCTPLGIGKLTNLQKLNSFNVGKSNTSCVGLEELKDLKDLSGTLQIGGLTSVVNIEDLKEANLRNKKHIEKLLLVWNVALCKHGDIDVGNTSTNANNSSTNEHCEDDNKRKHLSVVDRSDGHEKGIFYGEEVVADALLESLWPHTNLTELRIENYGGVRFPSWMGEPSFSKLTTIELVNCECNVLPPLGQLPSLKFLKISGMVRLKWIARELCCSSTSDTKVGFPSLEVLKMESLKNLEEWCGVTGEDFPCLSKLYITKCSQLTNLPTLPFLQSLYIDGCDGLFSLSFHQKNGFSSNLQIVKIINCSKLTFLAGLHKLDCLEELKINNCSELKSIMEEKWLLKLQTLHISNCRNLSSILVLQNLTSLRSLKLIRCSQLNLFPADQLPSNLRTVILIDCWKLTLMVRLQNLSSLKRLKLRRCYHLQPFPNDRLSSVPEYMDIIDCPWMKEWCQIHEVTYTQELSMHNEMIVSDIRMIDGLPSVEYLCLKNISYIARVHMEKLPSTLRSLQICFSGGFMPLFLPQNLSSLERLIIRCCTMLTSVSGIQYLISLQSLAICNCPEFKLTKDQVLPSRLQSLALHGCDNLEVLPLLNQDLSALKEIQIWDCCKLKFVTGLKNLTSLQSLSVKQCPLLEFSPDGPLSSNPQRLEVEDCPRLGNWCKENKIPYNQTCC